MHILASPGYAPGTIAVNVTRLERGFNACKTPRCIYPSIFNHFWNIAIYRWRVIEPSREVNERFLPHFAFPWLCPWDNCGKFTRLERGFNACKTPRCICPSIFNRFWDIASYWSKIASFSYPLAFNAPFGGVPIGIPGKSLDLRKTKIMGLPGNEDSLTIGWVVSTQYQRVTMTLYICIYLFTYLLTYLLTYLQTDRQTDRRPAYS